MRPGPCRRRPACDTAAAQPRPPTLLLGRLLQIFHGSVVQPLGVGHLPVKVQQLVVEGGKHTDALEEGSGRRVSRGARGRRRACISFCASSAGRARPDRTGRAYRFEGGFLLVDAALPLLAGLCDAKGPRHGENRGSPGCSSWGPSDGPAAAPRTPTSWYTSSAAAMPLSAKACVSCSIMWYRSVTRLCPGGSERRITNVSREERAWR